MVVESTFVTISCDGAGCGKSVTFARTKEDQQQAQKDSPWMVHTRHVRTPDGREISYCSDECEIKAAGTGIHNIPEQKRIVPDANQAQVNLAAEAAKRAAQATAALKAGQGVQVQQV
jgi:hypothetical protein